MDLSRGLGDVYKRQAHNSEKTREKTNLDIGGTGGEKKRKKTI
jgi:hypothetical protein